ncbi:hypothetical protein [Falsiruegeria mediterranea]|uniref:Uncharacterized protein n=1 Tax=Falsiruegeria mediterranea M17 TaxID=1200281 RepID=A0A2R8CFV6_9RHOB|nr:hypothetical protein [Falsiruegeria mediterranea]SPJ31333.1 hypothetical protein TRM7615_04876 [Falsiruegeria mediterranea M17]
MPRKLTYFTFTAALGLGTLTSFSQEAEAQTYPIDCAILLCLSGGWPASAPCARARAEFIRRITPWPVEPPLQIWRCPMGASFDPGNDHLYLPRIFDALMDAPIPLLQSLPADEGNAGFTPTTTVLHFNRPTIKVPLGDYALHLAQERADIDISGPEFNFVRSIRVFDVRYARQNVEDRDGWCYRSAAVVLGTYGTQGDFSWAPSSVAALPEALSGLDRWGEDCPSIYHRSVFVDWRDFEGSYGYEQVDY